LAHHLDHRHLLEFSQHSFTKLAGVQSEIQQLTGLGLSNGFNIYELVLELDSKEREEDI
jgi:hypothetical protein